MEIKRFFFIIPYLNQNTTSVNRIQSFILEALSRKDIETKVLYHDFSNLNIASIGIDSKPLHTPYLIEKNTLFLKPSFNTLQNFAFWLINKNQIKLYKIATVLHQIIYSTDIFTIHNISEQLKDLRLSKNDYIIALGGPFGLFKTAYNLKTKSNINLFLDYRDPWTYGYAPIDGNLLFHHYKQLILRIQERKILKSANKISTVSESLFNFFPKNIQKKINIIPNAANYKMVNINKNPEVFNIIYLGTIYDIQLEDNTFFKVMHKWLIGKDQERIKLIFLGSKNNQNLKNLIRKFDLNLITEITTRKNKEEVKIYLENASVFLHLKFGDRKEIITSKQADYLIFKKPILLPMSDNGDIEKSIIDNRAGYICNSEEEITETLNKLYQKFLDGEIETTDYKDETNSREYWAKKFIDSILQSTPPSHP